jgi:hypothetical protein
VIPGDTPETLSARVLAVEHRILPLAVGAVARGDTPQAVVGPLCFDLIEAPAPPAQSVRATMVMPTEGSMDGSGILSGGRADA